MAGCVVVYPTKLGVVTRVRTSGSIIKFGNGNKVKAITTEFEVGDEVLVAMNMETNKVTGVYTLNETTPFPINTKPITIELPLFEEL